MTHGKDCEGMREAIMTFVVGEAEEALADDVRRHLEACPACRLLHDSLANEERMLRAAFDTVATETASIRNRLVNRWTNRTSDAHQSVQGASREDDDATITQDPTPPTVRLVPDVPTELADSVSREGRSIEQPPSRWHARRFVAMLRSKSVRWSVAAAVAAAVVLLAVEFRPGKTGRDAGIAFADVIQHVRQARTVAYRTVWKQAGMPDTGTRETVNMSGKFSRTEVLGLDVQPADGGSPVETVTSISIYNGGRVLSLDPRTKKAELIDYVSDGLPHQLGPSATLADLLDLNPANAVPLGVQVINGSSLVGFRVTRDYDKFNKRTVVVWVDPETRLPVSVEETTKIRQPDDATIAALSAKKESQNGILKLSPDEVDEVMARWPEVTTVRILTNIVFDVPLDESMCSLDPPPGYTLSITKVPR